MLNDSSGNVHAALSLFGNALGNEQLAPALVLTLGVSAALLTAARCCLPESSSPSSALSRPFFIGAKFQTRGRLMFASFAGYARGFACSLLSRLSVGSRFHVFGGAQPLVGGIHLAACPLNMLGGFTCGRLAPLCLCLSSLGCRLGARVCFSELCALRVLGTQGFERFVGSADRLIEYLICVNQLFRGLLFVIEGVARSLNGLFVLSAHTQHRGSGVARSDQ